MRRVIAHLDLDAFFASVELQRNPSLRGKAVIVCGLGPRAVVTTATYEARRFGVHSAMPASQARRLCPQAVTVAPDHQAYRAASQEVWNLVRSRFEIVEQASIDEGYIDLSDLDAPKGQIKGLIAQVHAQTGLTASAGIGPNKLIAKVASDADKPAGLLALSREMACERFAQASPILIPGIGPKTTERLRSAGLDTLARLRDTPPERLILMFGENQGAYLHRRARFEDDAALQTVREMKSQSNETTFNSDVRDSLSLEAALGGLVDGLCERLEGRGLKGRTIAIKVRLDDWTNATRATTLPEPTNAPALVRTVATALLRAYAPPRPVRLLGVRVASFAGPGPSLVRRASPTWEQLELGV